ncbi:hypothetical protein ETD86_54370, partial [Nonomuraea turkmeniaca]
MFSPARVLRNLPLKAVILALSLFFILRIVVLSGSLNVSRTGQLTPARVRRGFRNLRPALAQPAGAPKPPDWD